jgi:hypothetical protein
VHGANSFVGELLKRPVGDGQNYPCAPHLVNIATFGISILQLLLKPHLSITIFAWNLYLV